MTARKAPGSGRLSPKDWLEIEELYRQGETQVELARKYNVRAETISRHMTRIGVTGGDKADLVRKEIEFALLRKKREFAEAREQRAIDSKDQFYRMHQALLGAWAAEFKKMREEKSPLAALMTGSKTLREALAALKTSREEIYELLEIRSGEDDGELPELTVNQMSAEEEQALRDSKGSFDDDEDDEGVQDLSAILAEVESEIEDSNGS